MEQYEENRQIGAFWGWFVVFALTAGIIGWCMFLMMTVADPPREWDFGALPDVPAQSIYSTQQSPSALWYFPVRLRTPPWVTQDVPKQMPTLPEAKVWVPPSKAQPATESVQQNAGEHPAAGKETVGGSP